MVVIRGQEEGVSKEGNKIFFSYLIRKVDGWVGLVV